MQNEPSNADAPKRKRRWFQFSLRSLMIGVTLLCSVGGWKLRLIQREIERQQLQNRIRDGRLYVSEKDPSHPFILCHNLPPLSGAELGEIQRAFPAACVIQCDGRVIYGHR